MSGLTRLEMRVALREGTPCDVIAVLSVLIDGGLPLLSPYHPFFLTPHVTEIINGAQLLTGQGHPVLQVASVFRNTNRELDLFLDWLSPYIADQNRAIGSAKPDDGDRFDISMRDGVVCCIPDMHNIDDIKN